MREYTLYMVRCTLWMDVCMSACIYVCLVCIYVSKYVYQLIINVYTTLTTETDLFKLSYLGVTPTPPQASSPPISTILSPRLDSPPFQDSDLAPERTKHSG